MARSTSFTATGRDLPACGWALNVERLHIALVGERLCQPREGVVPRSRRDHAPPAFHQARQDSRADERALAGAGRADDDEQRLVAKALDERGDLAGAAEKEIAVAPGVGK